MSSFPPINCIERFELAVKKYGNEPCIEAGDRTVTYSEFHALTLEAASYVAGKSQHPKVAIDLPQGIEAYAFIVGTLIAEGMWCPIPVSCPSERRKNILTQFNPDVVVSEWVRSTRRYFPPAARLSQSAPAYVLFTSGSTGQPKGVQVARKTIDNFLEWSLTTYRPGEWGRWGQFSKLNFDLSVIDLFTSICSGGCLVVLNDMLSQLRPDRAIKRHRLTIWHSVPSLIDFMIQNDATAPVDLTRLKVASFAGEALKKYQLDFLFAKHPGLRVLNSYGTTEGGLNATWVELSAQNYTDFLHPTASIGTAIPGINLHLEFQPDVTPSPEQPGEVVISGQFVGTGYLHGDDPAFREIELADGPIPAFFTGDLAYEKEGKLYFTGRKDRQVKLLGNRIELEEISACIREVSGLSCETIFHADAIYAFVETGDSPMLAIATPDLAAVRTELGKFLEPVKIPKHIFAVERLPRNVNLKVDRGRLVELIDELGSGGDVSA